MRELQRAARLTRTPIILSGLTCIIALALSSFGGLVSVHEEPSTVGVALFQTFFSIAFALVAWLGPAVAASAVAGERSAQTWELIVLTGMPAARIARGKFLGALMYVYLYVMMLAPVATLSFLFGGVSVLELAAAFALLCIVAALWVAFGLSVSSKLATPSAALIVTLVTAIPLSIACYIVFGVGGSHLAHAIWPSVPDGLPVWLPTAYARAPLNLSAVLVLVACPLLLLAIPAWFFYEVTVANLSSEGDDRSIGLRIWFLACAPLLACLSMLPGLYPDQGNDRMALLVAGIFAFECFLVGMAFVIAGEPLGPARRLVHRWRANKTSRWRRFLGPSILRAASTVLTVGVSCVALQLALALAIIRRIPSPPSESTAILGSAAFHAVAYTTLAVGLVTWIRSRSQSSLAPRLIVGGVLFVLMVGPWVLMAIAGWSDTVGAHDHILVAAPSPAYVPVMLDALHHGPTDPRSKWRTILGAASLLFWLCVGLALLPYAVRRTRRRIAEHAANLRVLEADLDAEDAESARLARGAGVARPSRTADDGAPDDAASADSRSVSPLLSVDSPSSGRS